MQEERLKPHGGNNLNNTGADLPYWEIKAFQKEFIRTYKHAQELKYNSPR